MKKYKLKKDLPLVKAGEIVTLEKNSTVGEIMNENKTSILGYLYLSDIGIWLEEIKEKPKSIFDLKKGDTYYYINHYGKIQECRYVHEENLNIIINNGKSYISYEEAQKELEKRQAIQRIKKYCWENGIELADKEYISSDKIKFEICYKFYDNCFAYNSFINIWNFNFLIFKNTSDISEVIKNCENDLKIIFDV